MMYTDNLPPNTKHYMYLHTQLMLTSDVENFPGYTDAPSGPELIGDLTSQAEKFGAEFWRTECKNIGKSNSNFKI